MSFIIAYCTMPQTNQTVIPTYPGKVLYTTLLGRKKGQPGYFEEQQEKHKGDRAELKGGEQALKGDRALDVIGRWCSVKGRWEGVKGRRGGVEGWWVFYCFIHLNFNIDIFLCICYSCIKINCDIWSWPANTKHVYNICTKSTQRHQHCTNVIKMFCVYWVFEIPQKRIVHVKRVITFTVCSLKKY